MLISKTSLSQCTCDTDGEMELFFPQLAPLTWPHTRPSSSYCFLVGKYFTTGLCCEVLNALVSTVSMRFRGPQGPYSSALAVLRTLQPWDLWPGPLNHTEALVSASNYNLEYAYIKCCKLIGHDQ